MIEEKFYSTKEAAKLLGVAPSVLQQAVWNDKIDSPIKHGKNFAWTRRNIEQASWRILHRMPNLPPKQPLQSMQRTIVTGTLLK